MFRLLILSLFAACFASAAAAPAPPMSERDKIKYLMNELASSDVTFIRNGEEWKGRRAAKHLRRKLDRPSAKVKTARAFIDTIASKSATSSEPYRIRLKDGKTITASEWFYARLADLEAKGPAAPKAPVPVVPMVPAPKKQDSP